MWEIETTIEIKIECVKESSGDRERERERETETETETERDRETERLRKNDQQNLQEIDKKKKMNGMIK